MTTNSANIDTDLSEFRQFPPQPALEGWEHRKGVGWRDRVKPGVHCRSKL